MSTWQPTVIHISNGDGKRFCREKIRAWPESYMDDRIARKLPKCPACLDEARRHKTLYISHREQAHINTEKYKQERVKKKEAESISPLYLVDYINKLNKSG